MSSIILCNAGSDSLSQIDLNNYSVRKIPFDLSEKPVGSHGIIAYNNKIYTANNYSDSVSVFYGEQLAEKINIKIGPTPNDLIVLDEKLYVICGEANSVIVYDLKNDRIMYDIKTGIWPQNMDYSDKHGLLFISNLEEDSITVIGLDNHDIVNTLLAPEYPTKVKVSKDKKYLYVCESYLGTDIDGYLEVFSLDTFNSIARINVKTSPMDVDEDEFNLYVSNFTDGTITIINKRDFKITKNIYVGGMPKCILKYDDKIFVGDYLKGRLVIIENEKIKKIIAIESEPNAMTIF